MMSCFGVSSFEKSAVAECLNRRNFIGRLLVLLALGFFISNALLLTVNGEVKSDAGSASEKQTCKGNMAVAAAARPFEEPSKVISINTVREMGLLDKMEKDYNSRKFPLKKDLDEIISENKRVDTGFNFLSQVINYNNRLDYYDLYIKLAKEKGYIVTDYIDYLTKYKNTDKKVLILRHDIDAASDGTKLMLEIEKKNGVKATYYFRWSTFDKGLIKEISNAGFEVGLHYETIATYCKDNNKRSLTMADMEKCRENLKKEIKEFKEKSGVDIETIASHGNPINKAIGIPNNVLLEGQNYSDYGIVGETYDKNILKYFIKSYICDGEVYKNSGFSYKSNPIDSIMDKDKVIEFLSHPNHWDYNVNERFNMLEKYEMPASKTLKMNSNQKVSKE